MQEKIIKLQPFYSSYFSGKSHSEGDGIQIYLIFQPMYRYFFKNGNTDHISLWKSKGISDESINTPATSDDILVSALSYFGNKTREKF